jgi:hypothetical protein
LRGAEGEAAISTQVMVSICFKALRSLRFARNDNLLYTSLTTQLSTRFYLAEPELEHFHDETAEAIKHLDIAIDEFRDMKMKSSQEKT